MFKRILVATDGSPASRKMLKQGMKLAQSLEAEVVVVHVYPAHFGLNYGNLSVLEKSTQKRLREAARREGEKFLEQAGAAAEQAGVACQTVLLEHDYAWKGIISTARKHRCEVIMMAAHSRRGLSALVLGSETNKVLMNSKIPVLVYR